MPKILSVTALPNYKFELHYDTDEVRAFDVLPYICGSWFGKLEDENYYKTVHTVDGGCSIAWAGGQDIALHELYEKSLPE